MCLSIAACQVSLYQLDNEILQFEEELHKMLILLKAPYNYNLQSLSLIITKMKKEGLFGMDNNKVVFFFFFLYSNRTYQGTINSESKNADTITSLQYYFIQKAQIKDESRSKNSES